MPLFGEIAAHSVYRMFCLHYDLVISHFGFEGGTLLLIATVPSHCLAFYFSYFPLFWFQGQNFGSDCTLVIVYLFTFRYNALSSWLWLDDCLLTTRHGSTSVFFLGPA